LLGLLLLTCVGWAIVHRPTPPAPPAVTVVWTFQPIERGAIISTPVVTASCVYTAAIRDSALAPAGVVYCLDRRSGRLRWQFDDGGAMLHTYSTPCLTEGRLYVGEGMHGNDVCKLYCLEAATGRKVWQFLTEGHIESSPCVADGTVFFGSGDDGLHALDAVTGGKRWHFQAPRHIDVSPAVADGRVFAGSGVSRLHQTTEIFCLRASDGSIVWRTATKLPVWGSPVVQEDQVFFGLGTGRLTLNEEIPDKPDGALLCADTATGRICWTHPVGDAVFNRPAVDAERVYFGARNGRCYCLDRRDGRRLWEADLGSPIVTRPALIDGRLYVVPSGGRVSCLEARAGKTLWTFDVAGQTQMRPQLLSSPVVVAESDETGTHHLVYFGAELRNVVKNTAVLYCLRD
jgi:outer membrane protein assembly factor BamB